MKGPEIHPAVDATNVQAQRKAEAFSEATKRAVAEATVLAEVVKRRRCKRAALALVIRIAVALALSIIVTLCKKHGLISWEVCFFTLSALACWLSLWAGSWLQYMWGREGLLR